MQKCSQKRRRRWTGAVVVGAAMAGAGLSSRGFGQTVATWVNPVDGFWVDNDRWSTGSFYPNNGTPTLADHYHVTIGASGAPYMVTLANNVSIDSLVVSSSDATLRLAQMHSDRCVGRCASHCPLVLIADSITSIAGQHLSVRSCSGARPLKR